MAAMARCRICKCEFSLARLLDDWRCCCPACDAPLAQDGGDRATILRKAAAADRLEAQLVEALSEIASLDSSLEVSIAPTVVRFLTEIEWERQLQDDVSFAQRQIEHLRDAMQAWTERLNRRSLASERDDAAFSDEMREVANQLRKVGDSFDHARPRKRQPEGGFIARAAAHALDHAADNVAAGRGQEAELSEAIGDAAQAMRRDAE